MHNFTRRTFVRNAAFGLPAITLAPSVLAAKKKDLERFQIGIQEYTFHRWLGSGRLKHIDYPALAKKELGITHIEYWNRPFGGKYTDKKYVGELAKRTTGEGMKNVLILIDASNELDTKDPKQRVRSVEPNDGDAIAVRNRDAHAFDPPSGGRRAASGRTSRRRDFASRRRMRTARRSPRNRGRGATGDHAPCARVPTHPRVER